MLDTTDVKDLSGFMTISFIFSNPYPCTKKLFMPYYGQNKPE